MPDVIDVAQEQVDIFLMDSIRKGGYGKPLVPGYPGECECCGEPSPRLVEGACAPCRDRLKLK